MPMVELITYAAHPHSQALNDQPELSSSWRVQRLGLTVVGKLNVSSRSDEFDNVHHNRTICRVLRHAFPWPMAYCQPHAWSVVYWVCVRGWPGGGAFSAALHLLP